MLTHFSQEFFVANRRKLRQLCANSDPIVVSANGLLQRSGDTGYRFSQDANFWYLTGLDQPDLILVLEAGEEYIIAPTRDPVKIAFDGLIDEQEVANRSGIGLVLDAENGWQRLIRSLKRTQRVNSLPAPLAYLEHYAMYTNPSRARILNRLQTEVDGITITDIAPFLIQQRAIKQRQELVAIRSAIAITTEALERVSRPERIGKYRFEYEIEADISHVFRLRGASGHAFDPIIASGIHACTIHNIQNDRKLALHDMVVMDVGAEVEHYAADITRTYCVAEKSYRRQQAMYRAVRDVQEYAFDLLKPGVLLKEYEKLVETRMGEVLRGLNLLRIIDHDSVRRYFPHATSHFLGLNVHDVGDYDQPLQPGMVLTVEPGIYVPDESMGVRIEDDVLVTTDGIEILTHELPRHIS